MTGSSGTAPDDVTAYRDALVRGAACAFARAHGHRYGRGSHRDYGCECDRCGAAMAWSDAGEFVRTGRADVLGALARPCPASHN